MESEGAVQALSVEAPMDAALGSSLEREDTHRKRRRWGDRGDYERIGGEPADRLYGPRGGRSGGGGSGNFREGGFRGNKPNRNVKQRKPASLMDKKKVEDEPQIALAKQIIAKVGDMASISGLDELASNISQLATILVDVGDLKVFPEDISNIFVRCMSSLPVQSTVVSTVLALVYRKEGSFPAIVVEKLEALLIKSLETNDIMTAKIILRSLASLAACNALNSDSVFASLGVLHDRMLAAWPAPQGKAEGAAFSDDAGTWMYLLATTIPWVVFQVSGGEEVLSKCQVLFERFLREYSSPYDVEGKSRVFSAFACPLDEQGNETTHEALGALHSAGPEGAACWDTLWESVQQASQLMRGDAEALPKSMLRPWAHDVVQGGLSEELSGELWDGSARVPVLVLSEGFGVALGGVEVGTGTGTWGGSSSWLTPIFPVFDVSSSPAAAACHANLNLSERCALSNYFRDILHFFNPVINEDGTYVGSLQLMMAHLWAVVKNLDNAVEGVNDFLPTLLIETLLHMLVQVPKEKVRVSTIARLLLELCKGGGLDHLQALGQGVHLLFNMVDEMDYRAYSSLADWFATHLINTQLTWPYWSQWVASVKEDNDGAFTGNRAFFCRIVVDKLSRQATPQNVHPTLMGVEELLTMLQGEGSDEVVVKMDGVDEVLAQKLRSMIELRVEDEEVLQWLEGDGESINANGVVLLQTLLAIGGNVPSSFTSLINRYGETLRTLSAGKAGESALVESLWSSTSHDGGLFLQCLDICLRRGVITCWAAATLLTSEEVLGTLDKNVWTARFLFEVAERALDIASTAIAIYPGDPSSVVIPASMESESGGDDDHSDESMNDEDDSQLAIKAALSTVRHVYSQFITSLVDRDCADMAVSCVSEISSLFKTREGKISAPVPLADRTAVKALLKKNKSPAALAFY